MFKSGTVCLLSCIGVMYDHIRLHTQRCKYLDQKCYLYFNGHVTHKMATKPADDKAAAEDKAAVEYFWKNCERLISQLNVSEHRKNRTVRIYENGQAPCVYAVVVNKIIALDKKVKRIVECSSDMGNDFWKLVKVGRTAADTTAGVGNRMEVVMQKIAKWCVGDRKIEQDIGKTDLEEMAKPLIFLRIDSKTDDETEEEVRKAMGLVIDKDLGKALGLPVHTEWVLTTQLYLNKIRELIKDRQETEQESTCALVFENTFAAFFSQNISQCKLVTIQLPREGTWIDVQIHWDEHKCMANKKTGNGDGEHGGTEDSKQGDGPVVGKVKKTRKSGKTDEP